MAIGAKVINDLFRAVVPVGLAPQMAGVVNRTLLSDMAISGNVQMGELAIQVRGAHKGYGSLRVLKGLDMSVPRGNM